MKSYSIAILAYIFFQVFNIWRVESSLPSKCPSPSELQSLYVKQYFETKKIQGFWYEIAMKDATQPHMCKCTTSNKVLTPDLGMILDDFVIQCAGKAYHNNLSFNVTNTSGVFIGTWNGIIGLDKIEFLDTVVDVGVNENDGYEWIIEFQCVNGPPELGRILFYAFNFYCRQFDNPILLKEMEESARRNGLAPFIDTGRPLFKVNHTHCLPPH